MKVLKGTKYSCCIDDDIVDLLRNSNWKQDTTLNNNFELQDRDCKISLSFDKDGINVEIKDRNYQYVFEGKFYYIDGKGQLLTFQKCIEFIGSLIV